MVAPSYEQRRRTLMKVARDRGWISLEDLMGLASGSPVNLELAEHLAQDAGIELEAGGDGWDDLQTLADDGPSALTTSRGRDRDVLISADEVAGSPAALYLREISHTPLLSAEEEVQLAKQLEAGREAERRLRHADGSPPEHAHRHLSPREVELLRLRFGLNRGGAERTLGAVGQELDISRERVRQLETQVMSKPRRTVPFRTQFRDYVE